MLPEHVEAVAEHLPRGEVRGRILVISDYRLLNLGHAVALSTAGYVVYTAVTCTDVPRVFAAFSVGHLDAVVFASLVHGWHHEEAERRPTDVPHTSDEEWQTRNIIQVIHTVTARQQIPPKILIATDLLGYTCYDINAESLAAAGIEYDIYSAGDPPSILRYLQ